MGLMFCSSVDQSRRFVKLRFSLDYSSIYRSQKLSYIRITVSCQGGIKMVYKLPRPLLTLLDLHCKLALIDLRCKLSAPNNTY